jgi:hypothetical protein
LLAQDGTKFTPHVVVSSDAVLAELRRHAVERAVRLLTGRPAHHPFNT